MRKIIETREFEFKGEKYQIRFIYNGISVFIRVFLNNKPANGYIYQITIVEYFDYDIVEEIVFFAKQDIIEQRYKEYLKVIKNT